MLKILAMIFFSIGAIAAIGAMLVALTEHWDRVTEALGLNGRKAPLPRRAPLRVRQARTAARVTRRPILRAAA